jgi:hypothetical protein
MAGQSCGPPQICGLVATSIARLWICIPENTSPVAFLGPEIERSSSAVMRFQGLTGQPSNRVWSRARG